jgi:Tol biopolymer transport system component
MAFADLAADPNVYSLAADHNTGRVGAELKPVITDRNWQSQPVVSDDGSSLVFRSDRESGWEFSLLDVRNGNERPITISGGLKVRSAISRDGTRIAYDTGDSVKATVIKTGATTSLCNDCRMRVNDWTAAGDAVLAFDEPSNSIRLVSFPDGKQTQMVKLRGNDGSPWTARISPDGKWLAYFDEHLRVVPFDGGLTASDKWEEKDTQLAGWLEWSPDGKLIYFTSVRCGPVCLWAVRPHSKEAPFPVMHFHKQRQALLGGFDVAPGRIYLGLHETTGNIWTGKLRNEVR